jgi:exoribonuclease R
VRLAAPAEVLDRAELRQPFDAVREALKVPRDFPGEALEEAAHVVPDAPQADLTALEFATLDPTGSTDLDQAMCLARTGDGWHVDYAIADVPAFVRPGGALDAEAMKRAETLYAPDHKTPLHPPLLSEDRASLLPDQDRQAYVWRFDLDENGAVRAFDLVRAMVRSRAQLDYETVEEQAPDLYALLRDIGERRLALEEARGGASLPLPGQEVVSDGDGFGLRLRAARPVEDWNAQLSLLTGMTAASLMLRADAGVLRTLPPPDGTAMKRFRQQALELGVEWPDGESYGAFLRHLDGGQPRELALLHAAAALFRGAAYTPFDGTPPAITTHAAVAAPYAHVTAPLRRLVDRFGLVAAYAAHTGTPVPGWVRAALPRLPAAMAAGDRLAGELDRRCVDLVELAVLSGREGEVFPAVVVDADDRADHRSGHVQLLDPPVLARCSATDGPLDPGSTVEVRLLPPAEDAESVRFQRI